MTDPRRARAGRTWSACSSTPTGAAMPGSPTRCSPRSPAGRASRVSSELYLHVGEANARARRSYEKRGFRETGVVARSPSSRACARSRWCWRCGDAACCGRAPDGERRADWGSVHRPPLRRRRGGRDRTRRGGIAAADERGASRATCPAGSPSARREQPRWVWNDTSRWYPPLLEAGMRVERAPRPAALPPHPARLDRRRRAPRSPTCPPDEWDDRRPGRPMPSNALFDLEPASADADPVAELRRQRVAVDAAPRARQAQPAARRRERRRAGRRRDARSPGCRGSAHSTSRSWPSCSARARRRAPVRPAWRPCWPRCAPRSTTRP